MDFDSFSSRIGTRQIEVAAPNTINQTITHCLWNLLLEHVLDLRENEWLVPLINEKDNLTGADARLMLITASALVNWIVAKDAGLTT